MKKAIKITNFGTKELEKKYSVVFIGTHSKIFHLSRISFETSKPKNTLTYAIDKEALHNFKESNIKSVILSQSLMDNHEIDSEKNYILASDPEKLFTEISNDIFIEEKYELVEHLIDDSFELDKSSFISENVSIGKNVILGRNSYIYENTIIEDNVSIGDNCVIGSPGLNVFQNINKKNIFTQSIGGVKIGKNALINNFVNIHKGTGGRFTNVKENSIIGSFVNLGHDVVIGENSLVIDGCKLAGHVTLGVNVLLGLNTTVLQNINMGDFSRSGIGTVVTRDIDKNAFVVGNPGRVIF